MQARCRRWCGILGLAAALGAVGPAAAEEPWPAPAAPAAEPAAGYGQTCGRLWLKAYQNGFSRMMKSPCQMQPSCSAYSLEAIQKHGILGGTLLTADRLYHEGSIQRSAPLVRVGDRLRYWDPVEDNVMWRSKP